MSLLIVFFMIAVPTVEIAVFITVGAWIGLPATLATVILTAVIGAALLRRQGLDVFNQVMASLNAGRAPIGEIFNGLCLLAAGALLLTPGFVTDAFGMLLFMPPFRAMFWGLIASRLASSSAGARAQNSAKPANGETIIEGSFEVVDPKTPPENIVRKTDP